MNTCETAARILRSCGEIARCVGLDSPIKILLVDDSATYCTDFRWMLSHVMGARYQVDVVCDVAKAMLEIQKGEHDLYVIDMQVNGGHGLELVQHLQDAGAHFPFIMLTDAESDDRVALGRDCMMWVHKAPCNTPAQMDRVLRYALKNWLTRKPEELLGQDMPPLAIAG